MSVTSRGCTLGLGSGSELGGFTRYVVVTSGAGGPSPQLQLSARSSLPGSVECPLNVTGAPARVMNVGVPFTSVVPDSSMLAVGFTLFTTTGCVVQVVVSSSEPQTLTVNVPSSP